MALKHRRYRSINHSRDSDADSLATNGTFQALQKRARAMLIRGISVFVERKTLLDAVS